MAVAVVEEETVFEAAADITVAAAVIAAVVVVVVVVVVAAAAAVIVAVVFVHFVPRASRLPHLKIPLHPIDPCRCHSRRSQFHRQRPPNVCVCACENTRTIK